MNQVVSRRSKHPYPASSLAQLLCSSGDMSVSKPVPSRDRFSQPSSSGHGSCTDISPSRFVSATISKPSHSRLSRISQTHYSRITPIKIHHYLTAYRQISWKNRRNSMITSLRKRLGYYDCLQDPSRVVERRTIWGAPFGCGFCYGCHQRSEALRRDAEHMRNYFGPPPKHRSWCSKTTEFVLIMLLCVATALGGVS